MKQKYLVFLVFVVVIIGFFRLTNMSNFQQNHSSNSPSTQTVNTSAVLASIPSQTGKNLYLKQSNNLTTSVDPELVDLDSQIITCSADVDSLLSSSPSTGGSCVGPGGTVDTKGKFLGGQCCGAMMNTKDHHENLQALQKYKDIPDVPLDPFHTPVDQAKKWIDYDKATTLASDEQKVYDQAMAMSKEGPCCCKCWHYYVNEGVAKKMIKDYGYSPQQISDFWNVSDICS